MVRNCFRWCSSSACLSSPRCWRRRRGCWRPPRRRFAPPNSIQWWRSVAEEILRLEKVCKAYNVGQSSETEVLHGIDLRLQHGEFLALMGPSGSGKSTLLNIVGLLDRPTSGRLTIKGQDTAALGDAEITHLRGHTIGFVFQYHLLISAFTAKENVMMPMLADRGFPSAEIAARADRLLTQVGLQKFADNLANNMSGGQ